MKFDPDDSTCQEIGEIAFEDLVSALGYAQDAIHNRPDMHKKHKSRICFLLQFLRDALKEDMDKNDS